MAKRQNAGNPAANSGSSTTATTASRKRSLAVPLTEDVEKRVRKLAEVTRQPLKDVLSRLGAKVEEALVDLGKELADEALTTITKELESIGGRTTPVLREEAPGDGSV